MALATALLVVGTMVGFAAAMLLTTAFGLVLPPFRPEVDDDTARQFFPVVLAYATWATVALIVVIVGWRRFRSS